MESEEPIRSLHELLENTYPLYCSSSTYEYLDVLDENADSRDTMIEVVTRLYHEFHICDYRGHLIVASDVKTYQHLQHIKREYGEQLTWLILFPGDFHILMNYQPVLSKVYFDVGLKQVAAAGGFKGEALTSLQHCSNFKNTHYFLIEVWEALYLEMLDQFLLENNEVNSTLHEILSMFDPVDLPSIRQRCLKPLQQLHKLFIDFITSKEGPNWKFWSHFVKSTCFSYIALFCAIRSGFDWQVLKA